MKSDAPYLGHIADSISAIENRLIHGYWSVDLLLVWDVIVTDLPRLKTEVGSLLTEFSGTSTQPPR